MYDDRYFIAKGKHLVVPVTKQEYEDYWNKKRKESMTNDEWRRTCSTEEFADFIRQLLYESYKPEERVVRKKIGDYFANKHDGNVERTWKEAVKEWLREKHNESV